MRRAAAALALSAGAGALLAAGDGGTTVIGGEVVRTGPVPVWLVELLYSPPGGAYLGAALLAGAVLAVAGAGYARNGGMDDEVRAEALGNMAVVCSMGGAAAGLAHVIPYWAAVPTGAAVGFAVGLRAQSWLGVRARGDTSP
jgi:hypothetical protein